MVLLVAAVKNRLVENQYFVVAQYNQHNALIITFVLIAQIVLLWLNSHTSSTFGLVLSAFAFAFLGLTVYALLHEACHRNLNSDLRINALLGMVVSWFFPVSFTFMETVHEVHHLNNRTDNELFDYYYPDDNLFFKYWQWYSILIGIYPPIIPIASMLLAFIPSFFNLAFWKNDKSSSIIFDKNLFTNAVIQKIRIEVILGIVFWVLLFQLLDLKLQSVIILYVAFWINWSTRQYVTHAFSPRHVIDGAWNLKVSRLMGWIFLNGHWDKVHHQYPRAAWQTLPALGKHSQTPISYWRQYFRLWLGPQPNREPAPIALDRGDQ